MTNQVTGKVIKVLEAETGTGKKGKWEKQTFIVEYGDKYPVKAAFEVWGDKVQYVGKLELGQDVRVSFNPESREYNNNWYTTNRAWKIETKGIEKVEGVPGAVAAKAGEEEDLPF